MTKPFLLAANAVAGGADAVAEAAALVEQMTLEEKLGCLDGDMAFWPGLVDMMAGGYYKHPWPAAVVERLGIPGIQFSDGPRGAVIADGTAFPVSMARGAMFDPAMEERIGDAIGLELRASGATYTGAVCMNLLRHPAWGRAQETYGEDPHHVGRMAAAFTVGLERHVMACMKHFALNSMENARFTVDVEVDERALHEVYLPHFRHVAAQGIASVMSAYNSVNGEWCGEHETLLTTILRDEWGWDGFVISDFIFGLRDSVKSVTAGLDIEMPFRQQRAVELADAVADGRLEVRDVDRSVERIVSTLLRYQHVIAQQPSAAVVGSAPHRALARRAASASTVMLRNAGSLLPVRPSAVSSVVVVGRLAAAVNLGDGGSSDVKSTSVVTPLDGIVAAFPGSTVAHTESVDSSVEALIEAADLVVLVVGYTKADEGEYIDNSGTMALAGDLFPAMDHPELGFAPRGPSPVDPHPGSTPEAVPSDDSEVSDASGMAPGGDRDSLGLSAADESLIARIAELSDRVVVSVQCGSAVVMPWVESVSAVLVSWYSGVEGGSALGDVLTGVTEPGGRLPFAIPADLADLVPFDKNADHATYGLLHGQWHLDAHGHAAQFPFGAGLGYSDFSLRSARYVAGAVSVEVANSGDRTGSTVVFVFGSKPDSAIERPERRLVGFARVHAPPGQLREVSIDVDWSQLDIRHNGAWETESGEYLLSAAQNAGPLAASQRVSVAR